MKTLLFGCLLALVPLACRGASLAPTSGTRVPVAASSATAKPREELVCDDIVGIAGVDSTAIYVRLAAGIFGIAHGTLVRTPVNVGDIAHVITVDAKRVLGTDADGLVLRELDRTSGIATRLATTSASIQWAHVAALFVFVGVHSSLGHGAAMLAFRSGAFVKTLAQQGESMFGGFAADDGHIYWTTFGQSSDDRVWSTPTDVLEPAAITPPMSVELGLAVDGADIYTLGMDATRQIAVARKGANTVRSIAMTAGAISFHVRNGVLFWTTERGVFKRGSAPIQLAKADRARIEGVEKQWVYYSTTSADTAALWRIENE